MECPAGYKPGRISTLLGSAILDPSPLTCLRDVDYSFSPLDIATAVTNFVFPTFSVPGLIPSAPQQVVSGIQSSIYEATDASTETKIGVSLAEKAATSFVTSGGDLMGLFDSFTDFSFGDVFGDTSFADIAGSLITEVGLPAAASYVQSQIAPQPQTIYRNVSAGAVPQSVIRGAGAMIAGTAATGLIGGGWLATREIVKAILQKIAINKGLVRVPSLDSIVSLAKKALPWIGQAAVAAGLAITAEELSQLIFAHATKKRRRMNPGNVKALRRSMRRLESFHHLCSKADRLRRPRARGGKGCKSGSTQFVRQG